MVWSPLEYAALNGCQIRISSGGETKKIKVLDSEPNPSLAKSPNAHCTPIYTILKIFFAISKGIDFGTLIAEFGFREA